LPLRSGDGPVRIGPSGAIARLAYVADHCEFGRVMQQPKASSGYTRPFAAENERVGNYSRQSAPSPIYRYSVLALWPHRELTSRFACEAASANIWRESTLLADILTVTDTERTSRLALAASPTWLASGQQPICCENSLRLPRSSGQKAAGCEASLWTTFDISAPAQSKRSPTSSDNPNSRKTNLPLSCFQLISIRSHLMTVSCAIADPIEPAWTGTSKNRNVLI
jgi:hypothetical protein